MNRLILTIISCFAMLSLSCNQQDSGKSRAKNSSGKSKHSVDSRSTSADAKTLDSSNQGNVAQRISARFQGQNGKEWGNTEGKQEIQQSANLGHYKNWMEINFTNKQEMKLRDIVIPGTHNSGTFRISPTSNFANGSEISHKIIKIIQAIPLLNDFVDRQIKDIFSNWSKTQNKSIKDQLVAGIRFLDLRIAPSKQAGALMIVHGQESIELADALTEIQTFTMENPKEIIFLKYRVSHDFTVNNPDAKVMEAQQNVDWMIGKNLESFIFNEDQNEASIADVWSSSKNIILLNNNRLFNAWGQVHSNKQENLLQNIDSFLAAGPPARLVEICLCLTPEDDDIIRFIAEKYKVAGLVDFVGGAIDKGKDIIGGIFLTDDKQVALNTFQAELHSRLISQMKLWQQRNYRMNILSVDFYDHFQFIDTVIEINNN